MRKNWLLLALVLVVVFVAGFVAGWPVGYVEAVNDLSQFVEAKNGD